jgi:K+-transporting ATPase KdpF subunit
MPGGCGEDLAYCKASARGEAQCPPNVPLVAPGIDLAKQPAIPMVVIAAFVFIPLLVYLVYAIWRPERF